MIKTSHRPRSRNRLRKNIVLSLFGVAVFVFASGQTLKNPTAKGAAMSTQNMTLWQVIEEFERQIPFSKIKIEKVVKIFLKEGNSNDYFEFWAGGPIMLGDGVEVKEIDLRLKRQGEHPGFLVLRIAGSPVTLEQVRSRFEKLSITQTPRGGSLEEQTVHTSVQPWGRLSFGFKEANPDHLASIAFDPDK